MPALDMSLSELKRYKGINPKPSDFDAYWEKAVAEMNAVDPETEFIKSEFQSPIADCYDMYFTGVRGARIYAKCLKPKNLHGRAPALLMFHGYTGNSGDWATKLGYVASGFCVFALDCRGQGGKSEDVGGVFGNTLRGHIIRGLSDSPDKMIFRDVFLDTAQLAKIVIDMPDIDENNISAMGGSQGGALTIACAALEPRIKKAAPTYPFLCDYKRTWEMDLTKDAYGDIGEYFRRFDPRHEKEDEIFTQLGYIDLQHLACRIKAEVQMATGLMDNICPPSTQFAAYNKMTCKKEMIIYPDFGHEGLPDISDINYKFIVNAI